MIQLRIALAYLFVILLTAVVFPMFHGLFGQEGPFAKIGQVAAFVVTVYISACLTVFGMDHDFKAAEIGTAIHETNGYVAAGWHFVRQK